MKYPEVLDFSGKFFGGVFPLDSGDPRYQQATLHYMQYLDICILSFCDKFFWLNTVAWSTLGKLLVEILKQYLSFPCYQSLNLVALCKHISFLQHEVKAEFLETELGCKIIERQKIRKPPTLPIHWQKLLIPCWRKINVDESKYKTELWNLCYLG